MSIRDKLRAVVDRAEPVKVEICEWSDEEVYLLPMSGEDADDHRAALKRIISGEDRLEDVSIARAVVFEHLVEKDGTPVYDAEKECDRKEFLKLPHGGTLECYGLILSPDLRRRSLVDGTKKNLTGSREKSRR